MASDMSEEKSNLLKTLGAQVTSNPNPNCFLTGVPLAG